MKEKDEYKTSKLVLSGLMWKFGERITAQLISLVVSVFLARILAPADYGAVALVMVFITIANVFVSNGFGSALIQKQNVDNLDFSSVLYFNIVISVVLYFVVFITAPIISDFFSMKILSPVLRVLGIRIIVAAINSVQQAYVSRNMLFKRFFVSTLFGTIISGIVGLVMAYKGYGVWALVFQYLVNTIVDTTVLWFTVKWRPVLKFSWTRARILFSYGWKILVSALIDTGYNQLRGLLIGKIYTTEDLAYYNQGDKFPSLIVTNINASITSVLFPALSKSQDSPIRLKGMTRRAIQVSSYIMWPLMIGMGVCANTFIKIVLTEKWMPVVPFIRVFCFSYGLWPIHTANLQAINALGRSDLFLKLEIEKKIIGIVILFLTYKRGPFYIAIGMLLSGIISTFINSWPNRYLLNYSYKEQMKDIIPSLLLSLFMGICIYPIFFCGLPDGITLFAQVFMGIIIYLMLSIVTKHETLRYLLAYVRKK